MSKNEFLQTSMEGGSRADREPKELLKRRIILVTDLEGPHLIGDTALEVMSEFVRPEDQRGNSKTDYGTVIYEQTYKWFEEKVKDHEDLTQEGTDIIFTLAPLLAKGVTEEQIIEIAHKSKRTSGSEELIKWLGAHEALVVGVTTAWELPHRDIVREIDFGGLVGTHFPLDKVREYLIKTGRFETEMKIVNRFLDEAFALIDENDMIGLQQRIGKFYQEELGVTYDPKERENKRKTKIHKTKLGQIIEAIDVIGDKRKAEVAGRIFKEFGSPNTLRITVGDGLNDSLMLALDSSWSIAVNGSRAVKSAKIGVITDDMNVLIPLIEILVGNPDINLEEFINLSQSAVGDRAIIHPGGPDVSDELIQKHREMKQAIRGRGAKLP